jgi:hypothetical protein
MNKKRREKESQQYGVGAYDNSGNRVSFVKNSQLENHLEVIKCKIAG